MMVSDLLILAAARGVDLSSIGGNASNTDGVARKRVMTPKERKAARENHLSCEVTDTVKGASSRVYRRPQWSLAEVGMGAQGVPELPWLAACYSWAGDQSCYWTLWWGLSYQAQKLAQQCKWQPRVMGQLPRDPKTRKPIAGAKGEPRFYLSDLAQMVLDEDANRDLFLRIPSLYATYLHVEDETWERVLAPRYQMLQGQYEGWLVKARTMIQRKLMDEPVEVET